MTATDQGFSNEAAPLDASPRLFDNALLDKLSRVHWTVPLFVYVPVIIALAYISLQVLAPLTVLGGAALGYLIWTLIEYFGHRYLFHWEFPGAFGQRLHFLIHGVHHDHPNDPLRLVMPILLSGPIMVIAFGVGTLLFGTPLCYPVLTGFVIGYLTYDMVHFYTHHAEPTTKLGLTLRRLHLMHHFRDHDKGYGVSAPYWDTVFGTAHKKPSQR
ncbi:sterol desaturase family protein [Beijerinckia sp. L45]|uniref:sterol desaturase family protein n=1 Tax=Beijerinckia sp. L45 TaxID=1641855 RepID=UPI00131B3F15|nr:sterol desaturase family protein [Beijerinckia sp. L45]